MKSVEFAREIDLKRHLYGFKADSQYTERFGPAGLHRIAEKRIKEVQRQLGTLAPVK